VNAHAHPRVGRAQRLDGLGEQSLEVHVHEARRHRAALPQRHGPVQRAGEDALDHRREHRQVHVVRAQPLHHRGGAHRGGHGARRVAVGLHDPGVGVGGEERLQGGEVAGRLEQPAAARGAVLEHLEDARWNA
jgi:hypothetical protein